MKAVAVSLPFAVPLWCIVDQEYYEKNILHPNCRRLYLDSTELEGKNINITVKFPTVIPVYIL
jgi:hypothetical protein